MAVENYHLKWDSHVSYLNSSVATLYKNEKFADVVLYSSSSGSSSGSNCSNTIDNAIPTVGISAHKFILSSCSQFFATLFDNTPIPASNGVLYVVLPPELSHRAIQILVQYIYTGEATVSNDILNEVLRGGEILKIRGLCRTASQRESATNNSSSSNNNNNNSNSSSSCSNSIHYGTNGTRPQHMLPPTVIHGSGQHPAAAHTNDLYGGNKCSAQGNAVALGLNGGCTARYGIEQLSHSQSSIHSQIRGLGASVMPKDSPVIVKSPKLSQMGQLPSSRENKHHGSGITVNKEVAIDPDENCCYQAAVVPTILQHEPLQLPLPPPQQTLVAMGSGSLCNDVGCKNCSFNNAAEPEKQRTRQRHLSQSDEHPHRLPGIERLDREYSDERCETSEIQLNYSSSRRSRNSNERVSNYFVTDHYDPGNPSQAHLIAAVKTPKQYDPSVSTSTTAATAANSTLHSPPIYPHNFLTIKQEPVDWTTPQANPTETVDDMVDRPPMTTSPHPHGVLSPKQPLDFKIPVGNAATVKIEAGITSTHSTDEDEIATGSVLGQCSNFSRLICDVCKKSFNEPKLWVQHLETHTSTAAASVAASQPQPQTPTTTGTTVAGPTQMTMPTNNTPSSTNEGNAADTLNKSYVPKKRRRVSQQENSMMDHVTLLCDLCNTSFDTPAEWVRHMNNQHTEIELAMFNSKKDKEQKSTSNNASTTSATVSATTPTTTAITCSSSSRNQHQHHNNNSHHHHHHQSQHHHKHQQANNKKYSNRSGVSSTHNRNSTLVNEISNSTKILQSSAPETLDQQRITHAQSGSLSNNSMSPSPPSTQ